MHTISIVIPVYNSEGSIGLVVAELAKALPNLTNTFEVILVEDDSADNSWAVIESLNKDYEFIRAFKLMRNYGQHNALLCGIRAARYELIVTMDDDLQHPIEKLSDMIAKLDEGYDVIYGSPEKERHGLLRDLASQVTKLVLQKAMGADIAQNISAYRVFRTDLRQAFADYHGPSVNIDVLLTWGTKRFAALRVPHRKREIGVSNYTFTKLVNHAFNMVTGFSVLPLQLASWLGFFMTAFGIILLFYLVVVRILIFGFDVPGFTFLASIISIFAGAQMFVIGIIGEYLARMHFRLMDKPPYVVRHRRENDSTNPTINQRTSNEQSESTELVS